MRVLGMRCTRTAHSSLALSAHAKTGPFVGKRGGVGGGGGGGGLVAKAQSVAELRKWSC